MGEPELDLVLRKPSGVMVEQAVELLHRAPAECAVMGHGLDTDGLSGERAWMWTLITG